MGVDTHDVHATSLRNLDAKLASPALIQNTRIRSTSPRISRKSDRTALRAIYGRLKSHFLRILLVRPEGQLRLPNLLLLELLSLHYESMLEDGLGGGGVVGCHAQVG